MGNQLNFTESTEKGGGSLVKTGVAQCGLVQGGDKRKRKSPSERMTWGVIGKASGLSLASIARHYHHSHKE